MAMYSAFLVLLLLTPAEAIRMRELEPLDDFLKGVPKALATAVNHTMQKQHDALTQPGLTYAESLKNYTAMLDESKEAYAKALEDHEKLQEEHADATQNGLWDSEETAQREHELHKHNKAVKAAKKDQLTKQDDLDSQPMADFTKTFQETKQELEKSSTRMSQVMAILGWRDQLQKQREQHQAEKHAAKEEEHAAKAEMHHEMHHQKHEE